MKRSRRHTIYDPFIINRVKQYLEENTHQTHVSVPDMARALQDKYRDYNRKKVAPFRQLVEHAYQIVLHSYGLGSNTNSEADEESDIELLDEEDSTENNATATPNAAGLMNDVMNMLYNKKPATGMPATTPSMGGNVGMTSTCPSETTPIDISSDEGGGEEPEPVASGSIVNPQPQLPKGIAVNRLEPSIASVPPSNGDDSLHVLEKRMNTIEAVNGMPPQTEMLRKKRKMAPIQAPALSNIKLPSTVSSSTASKKSATKKEFPTKISSLSFKDVGGVEKILKELCELLLHLKHPELYEHIGLTAPRGFLLHGPPGSGKTLLANAIAGQLKVPLIEVAATELVAGISGESEERIREVFEKAASVAPCVLFIDEVDVISANRNNAQKDLERRIVSQLLSSLDGLGQLPNGNQVVVIGATNRADILDPALRRVGRFDQEICLGIPDRKAREAILRIVCQKLRLEEPFNYDDLAVLTPGYVGADLLALAMRAAIIAVKRAFSLKSFAGAKEIPSVESSEGEVAEAVVQQGENPHDCVDVAEKDVAAKEQLAMDVDPALPYEVPIEEMPPSTGHEEKVEEGGEKEAPEGEVAKGPTEEATACEKIADPSLKPQQLHSLEEMLEWLNSDNDTPLTKDEIEKLRVTMDDFKAALAVVQPSAKREGFITVPDVTWENIGSLGDIRDELKLAILAPVKYPQKLRMLGLQSPSGVLLCGPPGCGKTLLAKAVANEAGINFISVKGPELLNMYVGESERAVRQCFQRAKNSAPCVIFFDEFDALCPKRSNRSENTSGARVVNQLLTEMDGVEDRRGVFLMAATNRPDMIDGAVLRPGRLDKILYVGLPEDVDREDILRALTKGGTKPPLADDVVFRELAEATPGFTGADLGGLVREASLQALKESLRMVVAEGSDKSDEEEETLLVHKKHFMEALKNIKPSVTDEDKRNYERLRKMYGAKESVDGI